MPDGNHWDCCSMAISCSRFGWGLRMVSVHRTTYYVPHGGLGQCQCTIYNVPHGGLGWCQCTIPPTLSHMRAEDGVSAPYHLQCPTWGLRMVSVHHTTYNVPQPPTLSCMGLRMVSVQHITYNIPHGGLQWCQCTTPLAMSHMGA